jgi:TRAP-type C4-dicarboxylate transport system permease small subunit
VSTLQKIDAAVYRVEKAIAWMLFLVMVTVMSVNLVHRTFSRHEGKFSGWLITFFGELGIQVDPAWMHGTGSLTVNLVLGWLVCLAATLSVEKPRPEGESPDEPRGRRWTLRQALPISAALVLGLALFVKAVLIVLPNGMIEAIKYSLICVLWIGLIGASVATYEKRHLALEIADRIWPKAWAPKVKGVSLAVTAGFVLFLLLLSVMSVEAHRETWQQSSLTGVVLGTDIPLWTIYLVFPYALGVMALRFLGQIRGAE